MAWQPTAPGGTCPATTALLAARATAFPFAAPIFRVPGGAAKRRHNGDIRMILIIRGWHGDFV